MAAVLEVYIYRRAAFCSAILPAKELNAKYIRKKKFRVYGSIYRVKRSLDL
jgi:hypothetical protein